MIITNRVNRLKVTTLKNLGTENNSYGIGFQEVHGQVQYCLFNVRSTLISVFQVQGSNYPLVSNNIIAM